MALTWSPTNIGGNSPSFVLPGTGEADWTGYVDRQMIPRAIGSATRRYIATSNNDQAGTAMDGNPFQGLYRWCWQRIYIQREGQ